MTVSLELSDLAPEPQEWMDVTPSYVPRYGWRLLLNGRELLYNDGGLIAPVRTADQIAIFPPGR